jgi:hypothetical protein
MKTTMQIIKEELRETINGLELMPESITTKSERLKKQWYSEEEIRDKILATTITSNKYGHEGYINSELLKIALFGEQE